MKFTESMIKLYAAPLSDTENKKCINAIREIRDALRDLGFSPVSDEIEPIERDTFSYSTRLKRAYTNEEIQVFVQGSYANNTCVRGYSDVDIAIMRKDQYEYAFRKPFVTGTQNSKIQGKSLKDAVEKVLNKHFPLEVTRGKKSIKVNGNSFRKKADTVPCLALQYYNECEEKKTILII